MKKYNKSDIYEEFHKKTKEQKSLLKKSNFTYHIIIEILDKYIKESQGKKNILDIGCGSGTISVYLASKKYNVTGIDISQTAINSCSRSANILGIKNLRFKQMNFPQEYPNTKYDIIVCFEVLEHLRNDKLALRTVFKLLKRNGILILSTPSSNAPLHRLGYTKSFDERVGHLRRYKLEELVDEFIDVGFVVLETRKTEGLLRNFLFINPIAGKSIRFLKFPLYYVFNFFDKLFLTIFGESDLFIVAEKPI